MKRIPMDVDINPETDIKQVVNDYIKYKAKEKEIDSMTKALNKTLKSYCESHNETSLKGDDGVVSLTYREKISFNEEGLIELLKNTPGCSGIVKTKEYIDFDELESALYNGRIQASSVEPYKSTMKIAVLNIKKL